MHLTHRRTGREGSSPGRGPAGLLAAVATVVTLVGAAPPAAAQVPAATDAEAVHALSLEEAILRALERNEAISIERAAADSAASAVTGAEGAYDPVLGLETGWRHLTVPLNSAFSGAQEGELAPTDEVFEAGGSVVQRLPTGGVVALRGTSGRTETDGAFGLLSPAYDSQLGVELRQPLLRDRGIDSARLGLRVARADRDRSLSSLRREVVDTVGEVERTYWGLVAARREIGVREDAVGLAREQLEQTGLRIEGGAAPETEIAQPRSELERRRGDLLEARERLARAENALKLLILGDSEDDLWSARLAATDAAAVEPVAVDVRAAMAEALAARPELASLEAFVTRRRAEAAFARDRVQPALDLVVSYDRFGLAGSRNRAAAGIPGLPTGVPGELEGDLGSSLEQLVDGAFDDARIGLVFEVPIGNRTARANAEIAENARRRAELELDRARKEVRAEVLDAAAALDTAAARVEAARAEREAAEVQLAAERDRYAVGLSTNFLVLTRQNDLASARLAEIEASTDYLIARTELARATGALLAERRIELDETDAPDAAPATAPRRRPGSMRGDES